MLTAPSPTSPATLPMSSDSRFVQIALETLFSGRFAVWYRKGGLSMTQTERRRFLLSRLLAEAPEYRQLAVPDDAAGQKQLLRALLNVRPPRDASPEFLQEPGCPPPPGSPTPGNDSEHISPILPANTALRICIPVAFTLTPPWRNTGRTGAGTFISTAIRTPQRPAVHLFWLRLDGRF